MKANYLAQAMQMAMLEADDIYIFDEIMRDRKNWAEEKIIEKCEAWGVDCSRFKPSAMKPVHERLLPFHEFTKHLDELQEFLFGLHCFSWGDVAVQDPLKKLARLEGEAS